MDLYDLIIYSREDGETIDKFSAEHLTELALKDGWLIIESDQRIGKTEYIAEHVGFFFQGR